MKKLLITQAKISDAIFRHYVGRETQQVLAKELGILSGYLARLIKNALDPETGYMALSVSFIQGGAEKARTLKAITRKSASTLVDGTDFFAFVDTETVSAETTRQEVCIGNVKITMVVETLEINE